MHARRASRAGGGDGLLPVPPPARPHARASAASPAAPLGGGEQSQFLVIQAEQELEQVRRQELLGRGVLFPDLELVVELQQLLRPVNPDRKILRVLRMAVEPE